MLAYFNQPLYTALTEWNICAITDGLVNMCKLADIAHRINRADEHDTQQVAHWIESEKGRREGNLQSLAQREQRLQVLRGEDEGKLMEQSVGKLKSEIGVLNGRLAQAVMEEDEARKVTCELPILCLSIALYAYVYLLCLFCLCFVS